MAAFCLPKKETALFLAKLRDGSLDPVQLRDLSSADRRAEFTKFMGEPLAKEVNALYESKLLLKDQQKGLTDWIAQTAGLNEAAKRDLASSIQKMEKILTPENKDKFLADLAAKKLGADVNDVEAKLIFEGSEKVTLAKEAMDADPDNFKLQRDYGNAVLGLKDQIEELGGPGFRNKWEQAGHHIGQVLGIPQGIASSNDLSAVLIQGWGLITSRQTPQAFVKMFTYFAKEKNFRDAQASIIGHPYFKLAEDGKLGITELGNKLSLREEAIQSSLLEQGNQWVKDQTGGRVPNAFRASNRAYTGYLNHVRFYRFVDLVNAAKLSGEDIRPGSTVIRDLARYVNDFSGRGAIGAGDKYANLSPVLNNIFFSFRKQIAELQMLNPWTYIDPRVSPTARKARLVSLTGDILATGAVLGLAASLGYDVELRPNHTNFGTFGVKDGRSRIGIGPTIYIRLMARLLSGEMITKKGNIIELGEGYDPIKNSDLIIQHVRNKLALNASFIWNLLDQEDGIGREATLSSEVKNKLRPMSIGSLVEFFSEDPVESAMIIPSLTAIFGSSLNTGIPNPTESGLTPLGDPISMFEDEDPVADAIDQEFKSLGLSYSFPGKTINGVRLTPEQFHSYVQMSGHFAKEQINMAISSPEWASNPNPLKKAFIKQVIQSARKQAQDVLIAQSVGTPNDILEKSYQKKQEEMGLGGPNVERLDKQRTDTVLDFNPQVEADLKLKYGKGLVENYDYGRLISTNPIAYVGFLALTKDSISTKDYGNDIGLFETPANVLGLTFTGPFDKNRKDAAIIEKRIKEAGFNPDSIEGKILLGPEFAKGTNQFTLEHELMHRGIMALTKAYPKDFNAKFVEANDESFLQLWQLINGTHGMSQPDAVDPEDYLKGKAPNFYKHKDGVQVFMDKLQETAKEYMHKQGIK